MWFLILVAVAAILWLLYNIAQNSGESLERQQQILDETRVLVSTLRKMQTQLEECQKASQVLPMSNGSAGSAEVPVAVIDLNTATLAELQTLPGVGKVLAKRVVEARPYSNVSDLKKVSGVSEDLLNNLMPLIKV